MTQDYEIAVLIPCYNESLTIGDVVTGFRRALPTAKIYVYDNNSRDDTAMRAALASASSSLDEARSRARPLFINS